MKKESMIKNTIIIMILTMISKLLGFVRESVIAAKFGASYDVDIYFFSAGIISIVYAIVGVALGTTLIPILSKKIEVKNKKSTNRFINNIITISSITTVVISTIGIAFSDYIVYYFAPGFMNNMNIFKQAVIVLKLMFTSFIFMALQNIFTGLLQVYKKYVITYTATIVSNTFLIIFLLFFVDVFGVKGFAIATVIGYFLQFITQIPSYRKLGYRYKFYLNLKDPYIKEMGILMLPVIVGVCFDQINLLIDRIIGSTLGEGAISMLNYASKVNLLFYTVIASTLITIIYPKLSKYFVKGEIKKYSETLENSIKTIILIMLPVSMYMIMMKDLIINIIYKRGAFTADDAKITALIFMCYAPTMILFSIRDICNRAFYSMANTKIPTLNNILAVILNVVLNLLFVNVLGVYGLALATSLSSLIASITLLFRLNKIAKYNLKGIIKVLCKCCISTLLMSVSIMLMNKVCFNIYSNTFINEVLKFITTFSLSGIIYIIGAYIFDIQEIKQAIMKIIKIIYDRMNKVN